MKYYAVRSHTKYFGIRYQVKEAREIARATDKIIIPFNTWDEADLFCTRMNAELRETI